jgi:hypothetical protein
MRREKERKERRREEGRKEGRRLLTYRVLDESVRSCRTVLEQFDFEDCTKRIEE